MHSRAFKRLPRALRVNSRELGQSRFWATPSTGSGLSAFLGSSFAQTFGWIVGRFAASRHIKRKKGPDFRLSCVTQKRLSSSPLGTGRVVETFSQNRQITVFISFRVKRRLAVLTNWKVTSCRQGIHIPLLMRRIFCPFVPLQIVFNWPIVVFKPALTLLLIKLSC